MTRLAAQLLQQQPQRQPPQQQSAPAPSLEQVSCSLLGCQAKCWVLGQMVWAGPKSWQLSAAAVRCHCSNESDVAKSLSARVRASAHCVAAVPLEFFAPVSSSIGVQLLQKMGWRQGKGIGSKGAGSTAAAAGAGRSSASKARAQTAAAAAAARPGLVDEDGSLFGGLAEMAGFRSRPGGATAGSDSDEEEGQQWQQAGGGGSSKWGAVSGVSIENTPLYVLEPKQDVHGLGFDPFEGAEEFRSRKRQKLDAARAATGGMSHTAGGGGGFGGSAGGGRGRGAAGAGGHARGIAFGTGALEESDTLGYVEDYIDADADVMANRGKRNEMFAFEEASDSGDWQ